MSSETGAPDEHSRRRVWIALLPLAVFALLAALFVRGLTSGDPSRIPSVLLGKPVPDFSLPALPKVERDGRQLPGLSAADLKAGTPMLVNVWASWCGPCRQEHPYLMQLQENGEIEIAGLNYKDNDGNARRFLGTLGNPYTRIGVDKSGKAAIDWGVTGVPETFLVDAQGVIRYKWIGPITEKALKEELLPRIRSTKAKSQ